MFLGDTFSSASFNCSALCLYSPAQGGAVSISIKLLEFHHFVDAVPALAGRNLTLRGLQEVELGWSRLARGRLQTASLTRAATSIPLNFFPGPLQRDAWAMRGYLGDHWAGPPQFDTTCSQCDLVFCSHCVPVHCPGLK